MPGMTDRKRRMRWGTAWLVVVMGAVPMGIALAQGSTVEPASGQPGDGVTAKVYYRAGAWEAFSGRAVGGGTFCGISTYFPRDGRGVMIRFRTGGTETIFRARKPEWKIPEGTRVAVTIQIGPGSPFLVNATGQADVLEWTLPRETMAVFDGQFRQGSVLTLGFPSGNEPPWAVPLNGSNAIGATFARCIAELAAAAAPTQPFATGGQGPAAVSPGPTQPFTAAPQGGSGQGGAASPAEAAPR